MELITTVALCVLKGTGSTGHDSPKAEGGGPHPTC